MNPEDIGIEQMSLHSALRGDVVVFVTRQEIAIPGNLNIETRVVETPGLVDPFEQNTELDIRLSGDQPQQGSLVLNRMTDEI